jgi:heptosyltransferase II
MRILILRLSSLGDIVLVQPICAWLRERHPEAVIDVIVKKQYAGLVSLMGCGLNAIVYEKSLAAHFALRNPRYDLLLDLHNKLSTWLLRIAANAKMSSVYHKERRKRLKIVRGNHALAISSTVDLYKSALDRIYPAVELKSPRLYVPEDVSLPEVAMAAKRILIFPGATHNTKRYPARYYKTLLESSPKEWQYIMSGSASEWDLCEEIKAGSKAQNCCGKLSFVQLLKLIETSDWVISSDSGPMHLAAALSRPQIAIFGATHPRLGFAPQNPHAHILVADLECQPCSLHGAKECPQKHFQCMHQIKVQSILDILHGV